MRSRGMLMGSHVMLADKGSDYILALFLTFLKYNDILQKQFSRTHAENQQDEQSTMQAQV